MEPDKIVFTGVMGYAPNEDAALYFSKTSFPLVRAQRPKLSSGSSEVSPSRQSQRPGALPWHSRDG